MLGVLPACGFTSVVYLCKNLGFQESTLPSSSVPDEE